MPTLTKKLRAGLILLAAVMPDDTYRAREIVTGRDLLEEKPDRLQLSNGSEIDLEKLYKRPGTPRSVNHERRLCRAFENNGRDAVLAYCKRYIEPEKFAGFAEKLAELVPAK